MSKPTKKFIVTYTDESDAGCPVFEWHCYAYDAQHAEMKFMDSNGDDGWKVVSVDRPRDGHGKVNAAFDREAA